MIRNRAVRHVIKRKSLINKIFRAHMYGHVSLIYRRRPFTNSLIHPCLHTHMYSVVNSVVSGEVIISYVITHTLTHTHDGDNNRPSCGQASCKLSSSYNTRVYDREIGSCIVHVLWGVKKKQKQSKMEQRVFSCVFFN